jgi:prepilin-type N-terminal cleavage/methylation domain-containing protein/prepilin-type processing-associated H-X9-DG protein
MKSTLHASRFTLHAFTIVELLVVMFVISILVSLFAPTLQSATERGRRIRCMNNLREIGTGLNMYANDHEGRLPTVEPVPSVPVGSPPWPTLAETLLPYLQNQTNSFRCPSDKSRFPVEGLSYESAYAFLGDLIDRPTIHKFTIDSPVAALAYDFDNVHLPAGGSLGKNILYADGHVKSY